MDESINKNSSSTYGKESEYTKIVSIGLLKKDGGKISVTFDISAQHIESCGSYDQETGLYYVSGKDLQERINQIELNHESADLSRSALQTGYDIKSLWEEKKNTSDPMIRKLIQNDIDQLSTCTYMP